MNVATLTVEGELSESLSMEFAANDSSLSSSSPVSTRLREHILEGKASDRDVARLLPRDMLRALRQWYGNGPAATLAVVSGSSALDVIPWERAPSSIGLPNLSIVRVLRDPIAAPSEGDGDGGLLVAGWIGAPTINLVGVQRELAALGELATEEGINVHVMAEPAVADLLAAWNVERPRCVHIAAPAVVYEASGAKLAVSGIEDLELVPLDGMLSELGDLGTRLILLNLCDGAFGKEQPSVARIFTEHLGATTISWYGIVDDLEAVDFARFFYSRLFEGDTSVGAVSAFNQIRTSAISQGGPKGSLSPSSSTRSVPVIWSPSVDALAAAPFTASETSPGPVRRGRRSPPTTAPPPAEHEHISVEFEPQRWLNPALLKNQSPAIVRLVLSVDRPMLGVGVSITCDAGIGRSTVALTHDLAKGPQPLDVSDLQFPVLYQLIDQATGRRWVNFTVRCSYRGSVLTEITRSVLWMGLSEWLDRKDMWHFIPAFVDPNADGVLKVLDKANGTLKTSDPTSSFDGYQGGRPEFVQRQVEAFFNCLRDEPFKLSYINVPPLEVFIPGESMPSGQTVRTPTEVIDHHRGTCHDLAILFASCLEHVGINPLIVLKPGHTYVGFWTAADTWNDFWKTVQADPLRLQQVPGRSWIITSTDEMSELVDRREVVLLEATRVTDRNATFDDALMEGQSNLGAGAGFDVAVDVVASRQCVQPL